ncbi:ubiquitin carboxyl-terminal hydrolase 48-like isoform X2 [Homalodisca vitripennis]|uniref:ubiquitin carboxyl-terminal hydrolase 48-like isoform X2 n=1 Tax=Homalodisca vitripennis TaxID=197043 RepID=UPI001EEA712B|nr:ubiquitin carboxyl-terminal hydrolase 48-like isoform X2 [Homalodisca vitripennis]
MPLKDQDKFAWGWAEYTDPKSVNNEHIFTAYRIKQNFCKNKQCRRNCRGNPFCLSGVGEARLLDSLNNSCDDANNALPRRTEGSFVGLKNLGATCYVNSLLQLWFHNKAFRDAIFLWNPLEDPVEQRNISLYSDGPFLPQSVVGHLQQLFALMFYSKCRYIDPSPFVESLRLDTSTQQDAQEFSKLFISLLESTLKHQSLKNVKNLVTDNFRGEYKYVTRCCKCLTESVSPSMFYELELNVKGHNTLTECLAEFLQVERLEGADCYSCPVCQVKQEACRFIKLCSLPPVLNLQLLRFVFDREKGQRKKLKTVVQFPETLDMKDFVEKATDTDEPLVYNLSAVLIHKGASASSGHFVAYIKDGSTGVWNTFNDESVEKLEGKKLKLDEEDPENPKKPKTQRLPKGCQSSTDAYMLVYTSEKHNPSPMEVKLPHKLQEYVDSQNKIFDEFCEEIASSKKRGQERQEQQWQLYNSLSVDGSDDLSEVEAVSTDWLVSWLDSRTDVLRQIDNTRLVCPHDRLDPCVVTGAKYVSSLAADVLYDHYGGGPRLRMSDAMCEQCVTNNCLILRTKAKILEESKEVTNLLKKRMQVDEPGYFVDKYCLKTWRSRVLSIIEGRQNPASRSNNGATTSANGEVPEPAGEDTAAVLTEPAEMEREAGGPAEDKEGSSSRTDCRWKRNRSIRLARRKPNPTITVPLSEIKDCFVMCHRLQMKLNSSSKIQSNESSLLVQCKQLKIKLRRLAMPNRSSKTLIMSRLRRDSVENKSTVKPCADSQLDVNFDKKSDVESNGEGSQPCDSSEKTSVKLEEEENSKSDDGMAVLSKAFNEGVMCPHGNLSIDEAGRKLVPVRVWEIFKQYFPSAPSFSHDTEPCLQCQHVASKDEVLKQHYYESATNQKKILSDLYSMRNRPQPGRTEDTIFLLHKQHFHQPWSSFLKTATRKDPATVAEPPSTLKVDTLLCVHGLLHYSPEYEEDQARLVLVTRQEWETLTNFYASDLEVTVAPDLSTSPQLCQSCFAARLENEQKEKLNYDRARLNIRLVPSASSLDDQESDSGKVMKTATNGSGAAQDVRRSARTRKVPGQKEVHVTVSSSLTLRELKQMITGQLAVAPFDQHLSTLDGKELNGDFNTLSSLGILPNTTLLLQVRQLLQYRESQHSGRQGAER